MVTGLLGSSLLPVGAFIHNGACAASYQVGSFYLIWDFYICVKCILTSSYASSSKLYTGLMVGDWVGM